MDTMWNEIDQYMQHWIREAGERIRDTFQTKLTIETKSNPSDLVTNVDREIEQFFIERIRETFPTHHILGEEGFGDELRALDGIVWIIDPIDGTMNFIHQQRNFAISVGVFADGVGMLGYIYDVVHDELYYAHKGKGAFMNDTPLPKLKETTISEAVISLNATWVTENKRIDPSVLAPLVKRVRGTRSYGSAALEMAYVASGKLDAYITMRLSPWDFAAGLVIVHEVGGIVTNLYGEPLNLLEKSSVFVSKPRLHQEILTEYIMKER
ncbi:myo-inositol-1(or 4)-monophosphatase [Thermolongibacillus altinsuensis]|jgi:myo-inositol-1(or 4)-monophosphatase|uniref:inositol-phosphate phosphatase n=2 Tax=Thermolongibacillus altinsuensis TaxID=575256 RepID=A0A4R1QGX4_9BACL|nr:inositol monophosphatase family protein [Thermolongibacillus altinsuensis]TCL50226.1 myo-inositol-1(or 4)-monophosphatase [Thermolongibacillus altinsuensis]GMB08606.1 inositol-1-monophosphatase [Thermolongibacillus altinsuensis]